MATGEGEEGRDSKGLRAPQRVGRKEREDHERTHTPYRSWCKCCVWARGMKMAHRRQNREGEEDGLEKVPRVSMDYWFMGEEDREAGENPLIVVVNERTGEKYARAVGRKGVGTEGEMDWLIKAISEEVKAWGHAGGEKMGNLF